MAKPKPSQEFIPFKEVRDGIVVMKDGALRGVLMASSLNISLKSQDEQEAIYAQFQNFLNSLEFSLQFYVQSRRLDIRPYLALLEEREKDQVNELMKIQTREYIEFIRNFTESTNIMSKSFFIIVPYNPTAMTGMRKKALSLPFMSSGDSSAAKKDWAEEFEESKTQIEQRMGVVDQGLTRLGVRVVQLGTEEIIELFYKIFNPGELDKPVSLHEIV